ncbi:MAG: Gfo/Idh/MocA family oxidoreductase [Chloroflexi bacterium]|nr:Gfo/Idh/MocA family oxidoreductase [Chloroflexota bacterium]
MMRVGIIGLGSIGQRHAKNVSDLGHELVVCDQDLEQLGRWSNSIRRGQLPHVKAWLDVSRLWAAKPDCVLICTPPDSHRELAHAAIDRGIPTFMEKPITNKANEDWGYPAFLAERHHVITMVGCNMRFHAGPATVKRWLEDKAIGDVLYGRFYTGSYLPDWVLERDYKTSYVANTGVILDAGSHELDLALWMLGPAKLHSAIWRPATSIGLDCDGLAELVLAHDTGAISTVHLNFVQHDYQRGCCIVGTKGRLSWDWEGEDYWWVNDKGMIEDGDWFDRDEELGLMYRSEIEHFLRCLQGRTETSNSLDKAIDVLDILLEAKEIGKP